jgi:hypothetical protein
MRAHRDSTLCALRNRAVHDARIAGMEPTRDIGRRQDIEKRDVIAQAVRAERFTDICNQVHHCHALLLLWGDTGN